ncbi:methylenetetrahydrofolate--tRNA-(uracil(54)-C(5))-methyltransferase (FADH(2)-oxidizing) TrmFO [Kosmotoga pacifica]|uniref:Methylenetetrahydrofolate--tRNA-(uracil-5-)-methyltransferase TrmFO n=1 Tax=Kosmotoga pacifica TaxID=1330330 RepID=A0A0G2Z8V3_9BACT|nr:methylenetetrahydrofolate--tRNA-(uracil(54)-C(5))-methyltransferase (FADH(2)-oxidizing) TrmFO [Kosmotoga pacifica]AKI96501.1 tRNA (uracil-5-)-methyltransferase [Kosmotoga pacifica]
MRINIVGGGLAGSEAALSLASRGFKVSLYEMRPQRTTEIHRTGDFAELVCSNSLKSEDLSNASGVLKAEATLLGSILIEIAKKYRVPAGKALAVDRIKFSAEITRLIKENPNINVIRQEVKSIELNDEDTIWIVATGPLSSPDFESWLLSVFDEDLFFFDAVAPIVAADSIDMTLAFEADRYGKGSGDYINCPLKREEYEVFHDALVNAERAPIENFSDRLLFERCQPVEEIARSGIDALRFGPMKPVGLIDPRTGEQPYAVVQLRKENVEGTLYNLVGFQTRLKWNEQRRVFRMIPALHSAEFVRYGVMHRNTYLNSPKLLNPDLRSREFSNLFFCGQITGLEGYVEAITSGRFVALNVEHFLKTGQTFVLPKATMLGALIDHITISGKVPLNPVYANFGLLPSVRARGKREKKLLKAKRAIETMKSFLEREGIL